MIMGIQKLLIVLQIWQDLLAIKETQEGRTQNESLQSLIRTFLSSATETLILAMSTCSSRQSFFSEIYRYGIDESSPLGSINGPSRSVHERHVSIATQYIASLLGLELECKSCNNLD